MLDPEEFIVEIKKNGFNFLSGVPCSFLKGLINSSVSHCEYITAANEGDAVAICAGAYLGGKKTVVLMQNSGLTNALSPLSSLNFTFEIPVLGFVSLRGEKTLKDEPQHELMGRITTAFLDLLRIEWEYLSPDSCVATTQLEKAFQIIEKKKSFFFVVRKNTFNDTYVPVKGHIHKTNQRKITRSKDDSLPMRIDVLKLIHSFTDTGTSVISTTGFTSRELYDIGDADNNFYMIGSMGCASSIGLGLSLAKPHKNIIILDGDGALLMRLGCLATNGSYGGSNLLHILLDNNAYESTGGQGSTAQNVNFVEIAADCGYTHSIHVHDLNELNHCLSEWIKNKGLTFLHIKIREGTPDKLGRPSLSPPFIKERFMEFLND
jgi:phosphonopyruvate decarboxylase